MSRCNAKAVERYLTDYGWSFETADGAWFSGWQGENCYFPLRLSLSETCLRFEVTPLVADGHLAMPALASYFLGLNTEMRNAKIALSDEGDLALVLDVLAASLTFGAFSEAVGILAYYADVVHEAVTTSLAEGLCAHAPAAHLRQ